MGSQVQGFTFNIGDSATNNGYGGDGGTTSNSAEIHSNDNRFYVNIIISIFIFSSKNFILDLGKYKNLW
jgi:hypothetical protein